MKVLGIETSCDETAAAVVELNSPTEGAILHSNEVLSSMDLHKAYGGVVPEIAARSHMEAIIPVIESALSTAGCTWGDIDAIGVTYGAGLGGSLLVGVQTAKTLATLKQKPLYAINHVEGHIYANFIVGTSPKLQNMQAPYALRQSTPSLPMLGLIVSGGHTQLVIWKDHFNYTLLGRTRDDAIGEAFDKVAKIIGLPYPGGPSIAKRALLGDDTKYRLPKAKLDTPYEFSFSGLKTAVLRLAQEIIGEDHTFASKNVAERLSDAQKSDIAASFQRIAIQTVVDKCVLAFKEYKPKSVVIGGGVASSQELRKQLAERLPVDIAYTDPRLCTDNGAMIASLGCYSALLGQPTADPMTLDIKPNLSM